MRGAENVYRAANVFKTVLPGSDPVSSLAGISTKANEELQGDQYFTGHVFVCHYYQKAVK
jgi:hypothetical protein